MTTDDVAREIGGVSDRWVRRQIEAGRLPARALVTGRVTYRIRRADFVAFVARTVIEDARDRDW